MTEPVVWVHGLCKYYKVGNSIVRALIDVSVLIKPVEFIAVVGRSGSGKSILLNLLGLLDRPDSGFYSLVGRDITKLGDDARARIRNREIGFVFQNAVLLPRS